MWNSVDILTINFLVNRQTTESVICCLFSWTITVEPCLMTLLLTNSEMGAGLMRESWASLTVFIPLDRERAVERSPGRPTERTMITVARYLRCTVIKIQTKCVRRENQQLYVNISQINTNKQTMVVKYLGLSATNGDRLLALPRTLRVRALIILVMTSLRRHAHVHGCFGISAIVPHTPCFTASHAISCAIITWLHRIVWVVRFWE